MRKIPVLIIALFLTFLLAAGCGNSNNSPNEDHTGHAETIGTSTDAPAGEVPGAHTDEVEVEITPAMMEMAGITLAQAGTGRITVSLDLSGEVGFNEDRLVHVTPRFSGIAREIRCRVGDSVREGDVIAVIESNESLTEYTVKAPISGRIIEKHLSKGEYVSQEQTIYMIADLSDVWVNLAVYSKDASKVRPGQKVTIHAVGDARVAEGKIQYITPVMDHQTRRLNARVVLLNIDDSWRPGTFVNAYVEAGESEPCLVVEKNAVQILNDKTVVFLQHEPGFFKPVEVSVGESDSYLIRILKGLESGTEYVNNGAFEIKAKIVTSSLGGHAGHGH